MHEPPEPDDSSAAADGAAHRDEVGSVAEEAAKLFSALSDWGSQQRGGFGGAFEGLTDHVGHGFDSLREHIVEDDTQPAEDCRWCPVCQVIHAFRATNPEVREHLSAAANSLIQAASSFLTTPPPGPQRSETPDNTAPESGEPDA